MLRMSPEEFSSLQSRINAASAKPAPVSRETALAQRAEKKAQKRNKYGAKATTVDGVEFDSKAEAKRYVQLKAMEKAGEIVDLQLQVRIPLLPVQNVPGRKERAVDYICDFVYMRNDTKIYEDVKSAPTKTKEFILKRKMALFFHGIIVHEVMVD